MLDTSNFTSDIKYAPALYKIFDEILVNAADHLQRSREMNRIEVRVKDVCTRIIL